MIIVLLHQIFQDVISLGIASSYEEFRILLCGSSCMRDITYEDVETFLLSQITPIAASDTASEHSLPVIHHYLEEVEILKGKYYDG